MQKTAYGICFAFVWVCAIFAVLVLILGEKIVAPGSTASLELGAFTFEFAEEYLPFSVMKGRIVLGLVFVALLLVFVCYVLRVVRRILAPMVQGVPFDTAVSDNLRKLSWITLIGGGVLSVIRAAGDILLYRMLDLESLFLSDRITAVEVTGTLDMTFLLFFAVLYLLSCVFRYGETLQQQSDETL